MSQSISISVKRPFGITRVCRVWKVSRATVHRHLNPKDAAQGDSPAGPRRRRGPRGACGDDELAIRIENLIETSPFFGEGYRKMWARLRADGIRTAQRRVLRVMRENNLLAPHRPQKRDTRKHDGTIVTQRVDEIWGTDMTETITIRDGRVHVFIASDHCSGEIVGIHASTSAKSNQAIEPVRQGLAKHFGSLEPGVAKGLKLRHDHGSNYMSSDFQNEIKCFGITSSPAFVKQPQGNGVSERAIRTLKEQVLWVHHFETEEDLLAALRAFAEEHNASWLRQRHGYKTPNQIRQEQKTLELKAA